MQKQIFLSALFLGMVMLVPIFAQDSAGDFWFEPDTLEVEIGTGFTTQIHANTGTKKLGAYVMDINIIVQIDPETVYPEFNDIWLIPREQKMEIILKSMMQVQ